MNKYYIITLDGKDQEITKAEFDRILSQGEHKLYEERDIKARWLVDGSPRVLLPTASTHLTEVYDVYHKDERKQVQRNKRHKRCRVLGKSGKLIICPDENKCYDCPFSPEEQYPSRAAMEISIDNEACHRQIDNKHIDNDPVVSAERNEVFEYLHQHLESILKELKEIERQVITLMYLGDDKMSVATVADLLNRNWRTVARARDNALAKLSIALNDFKDYI